MYIATPRAAIDTGIQPGSLAARHPGTQAGSIFSVATKRSTSRSGSSFLSSSPSLFSYWSFGQLLSLISRASYARHTSGNFIYLFAFYALHSICACCVLNSSRQLSSTFCKLKFFRIAQNVCRACHHCL